MCATSMNQLPTRMSALATLPRLAIMKGDVCGCDFVEITIPIGV